MGLRVEYLDTDVIRSRIQMALHTVMIDCVIEHVPIIGVGDLPTPYTHGSQLTRPHARVVTQRLGDRMPWFVRVSVRLR